MNREIEVFNIARTQVDKIEVDKWLNFIGVSDDYELPPEEVVSNPALLIALAAKRCYMSFEEGLNPNVTKVRKDFVDYFDNILKSGHGSVLEHSVFSFAIENVTRVFTAEMNRHRAGWAISEGSLRYIRFDKEVPYWLPLSIRNADSDNEELRTKKEESRKLFELAFTNQQEIYTQLLKIWDMDASDKNFDYKKKVTSCLRRIIGLGVCTGGVWSGNVRAIRHVLAMRCSPHAEEEICYVFNKVIERIIKVEPLLFGDFYQDEQGFWRPKYIKV